MQTKAFPISTSRSRLIIPCMALVALLFFFIPMEHKYDKLFRFYSLTLIPNGLELPHHFDKKIYFYLSDIAAFLLLGIAVFQRRFVGFREGICLSAMVFFVLASIFFSPLSAYPVCYTRLLHLVTPFSIFFFLGSGIIPRKKLFSIASWSLFASGTIQAALASYQYLSQRSLGLRFLGEQPLGPDIFCRSGHRWLFDLLFQIENGSGQVFRAMGTMSHPNVLGGLLVVSLLLTGHFFQERKIARWLIVPSYLIQLFALAATYSRSAILAYALGLSIWFFWISKYQKASVKQSSCLVIAATLLIGTLFSEQYLHPGGAAGYSLILRSTDKERIYHQNIALNMLVKHPLTGVGYGQFSMQAPRYGGDAENIGTTHNIYLLLAAEAGLLALIAFLGWIASVLRTAFQLDSRDAPVLLAIFSGFLFIGLCDYYPISFHQGALLFFGVAGLLVAKEGEEQLGVAL